METDIAQTLGELLKILARWPLGNTYAGRTLLIPASLYGVDLGRYEAEGMTVDLSRIVHGVHNLNGFRGVRGIVDKACVHAPDTTQLGKELLDWKEGWVALEAESLGYGDLLRELHDLSLESFGELSSALNIEAQIPVQRSNSWLFLEFFPLLEKSQLEELKQRLHPEPSEPPPEPRHRLEVIVHLNRGFLDFQFSARLSFLNGLTFALGARQGSILIEGIFRGSVVVVLNFEDESALLRFFSGYAKEEPELREFCESWGVERVIFSAELGSDNTPIGLEGKKKAICRTQVEVDDEILRGTGFLVSSGEVLTCAHCLGETEEAAKQVQEVKLYFSRWPEGQREVLATPKEGGLSWELDLAVLVLNTPVPEEVVPLGMGRAARNEEWTLFGFPKQGGNSGLVIDGRVTDPNGEYQGKKVLQLNSSATRDSVKGASGSPIFVGEYVVGMLTNQLLGRNPANDVAPALEVIYALPAEEIAVFSGVLLAAQVITPPPEPENSPEESLPSEKFATFSEKKTEQEGVQAPHRESEQNTEKQRASQEGPDTDAPFEPSESELSQVDLEEAPPERGFSLLKTSVIVIFLNLAISLLSLLWWLAQK